MAKKTFSKKRAFKIILASVIAVAVVAAALVAVRFALNKNKIGDTVYTVRKETYENLSASPAW